MTESRTHNPEISLILPVYNVAGYIDECMESVKAQTFGDFEALLIDDGSTDGSADICDLWAAKDARIRVIHQDNAGVSAARNRGIREARGEYLAFVDPDDWLDPAYLEKLYRAAKESGADFTECDIWRYNGKNGTKIHRSLCGTMGRAWTLPEHMKYGATATYKSISKRSLWLGHDVYLPDCAFESPAVYALILALAHKIVNVPEPLYYYRRFRPESLIETGYAHADGSANNTLGIEAMEHLTGEFKRLGLYEQYADTLEGVVKYRLSDILATQFYRKSPEDYRETEQNFRSYLKRAFPDSSGGRYITFGGYNLNRILVHLNRLHDPYCRFNFSSIISLMSADGTQEAGVQAMCLAHPNRYRRMMLEREEEQAFFRILREVQPQCMFIDLIEERFDVLERGGRYVTASDAREGAADASGAMAGRRIARGSAECAQLFERACRQLASRMKSISPDTRIVMVENYLMERFGTLEGTQEYEDAQCIRRMNKVLKAHYEMLRAAFPDALVIRPQEEPQVRDLLFTDIKYEYGAIPPHVNELANRGIAALIEAAMGDKA